MNRCLQPVVVVVMLVLAVVVVVPVVVEMLKLVPVVLRLSMCVCVCVCVCDVRASALVPCADKHMSCARYSCVNFISHSLILTCNLDLKRPTENANLCTPAKN